MKTLRGQKALKTYYDAYYMLEHADYLTEQRADNEAGFLVSVLGRQPDNVCDVGCGAGQHLLAFAQFGVPRGYGFDMSAVLVQEAQKVLKPYAGYKAEQASFTDWNLLPDAYDIVYSLFSSFSYCLNETGAQELINKMVTAAKPNSLVCIDVDNTFRLMRALEDHLAYTKETNDKFIFDAAEMILAAEEKRDDMILKTNTRYFMATDFTRWLVSAGIPRENISFFGDLTGTSYSYAAKRLVVMARKNGG